MVDFFRIFRSKQGQVAITKPEAPRIFISYATTDGAAFASRLRRDLEAEGHSIWQDIAALEGGRDWWTQIEAALKSAALQHLVLVLTPAALSRPVILDEIHLAREQGKTVIPVRGPGFHHSLKLPRHIGQVLDLAKPEHHATFLGMLAGPSLQKPVPMMIPRPPADYVRRKAEIDALKARLLDPHSHEAVAITAALRGTTGYGKTTLARALAYDNDIRDAYFDGTLFVELGQHGRGRIVAAIADIVGLIDPERRRDFTTIDGARTALGEALGNRRFLLVIDDVWTRADLMPFLHGGPKTTRLITTRFAGELPAEVVQERVAGMTGGADGEAWQMLAAGLPPSEVAANKRALVALAERRHNWPQALRLANGFLRTRMGLSRHERLRGSRPGAGLAAGGASLAEAIKAANAGLDIRGGTALDPSRLKPAGGGDERYEQRHESVAEGMDLNLSLLDDGNRVRFAELAVFPEDVEVPIGIVARLWAETGGMDRHATEALLAACDDASLLLDLDFDGGTLRFHDSVREYLHDRAGKTGLVAQHKRLVTAMGGIGDGVRPLAATSAASIQPGGEGADPVSRAAAETDYFYRYLPEHLHEAGEPERLDVLLMSPAWMQKKLAAVGVRPLIDDYRPERKYVHTPAQRLTGQTLDLAGAVLVRDERQLVPQLLGRLRADLADERDAVNGLLRLSRDLIAPPVLAPRWPSLTPPGGPELRRLEGHVGWVNAVAFSPDGRHVVSGSNDRTLRLWEGASGAARVLEGHGDAVRAVAFAPDGRHVVSGSHDRTLRLWEVASGAARTLEGHGGPVRAVAFSPDGRHVVSGSDDNTLRLWEVTSGAARTLEGHDGPVRAVAFSPDGRHIVSGSSDRTLRLWEVASGAARTLEGHDGGVLAVAFSPDGRRIVSGSSDRRLRLWEVASGAARTLEGHRRRVGAVAFSPDGRHVVSGSDDNTLRLWEVANGAARVLGGHGDAVRAVAFSPDGRHVVSGSDDNTLRLWEVASRAARTLEGHDGPVRAVAFSPDGRHIVSGSDDNTLRLWEVASGAARTLEGHGGPVLAVAFSPDGRHVVSGSEDNTLRLWEVASGAARVLEGHASWVAAVAFSPDGRHIVSGSFDSTLRLWEVANGAARVLEGHDGGAVDAVAFSPDGRHIASGSDDTLLWEVASGAARVLEGRGGFVVAVAFSPDGRHVVSGTGDGTLRLWELAHGPARVLEGHGGAVTAVAFSPDGRHVVSGSSDRTLRLWEVGSEREIARFDGDSAFLALALDGKSLAAGDSGGRVHLIDIVLDAADKAAWLARRH